MGGPFVSPPVVTARNWQGFDVFEVGTDNSVYHKYWDGSVWHPQIGWEALGGTCVQPPAVTGILNRAPFTGALDVFAVGPDNQTYHKSFDGTNWHPSQLGWEAVGGVVIRPLAASNFDNTAEGLNVFAVSTDNHLYTKYWDGSTWHPWQALGGTLTELPHYFVPDAVFSTAYMFFSH